MATFISELFTASGRIGRLKFFLSSIAILVVITILRIILVEVEHTATGKLLEPYFTAFLFIVCNGMIAVQVVKRLHDLNRSGWYFFLFLIPFFNIIMFLFLIFKPGTVGANDYGPGTMPSSN